MGVEAKPTLPLPRMARLPVVIGDSGTADRLVALEIPRARAAAPDEHLRHLTIRFVVKDFHEP